MTLTRSTPSALAQELRLIDPSGSISAYGVANLARQALARWGLTPRRDVVRFVRGQLSAVDLTDRMSAEDVGQVLERITRLGECEEVVVGHERYLAPCPSRWIQVGDTEGVLIMVEVAPDGVEIRQPTSHEDLARRFSVSSNGEFAALHLGGIRQCLFREWLHPLGYLRHASRRSRRVVRNDTLSLCDFWHGLQKALHDDGLPLGEDAQVRLLTGPRGRFFGRHSAPAVEGRWSEDADTGVWCGYRRGYEDTHWHPVIVDVDAHQRRALDLFDHDEWRWAVLAKGIYERDEEQVRREGQITKLTFRPPTQLLSAMDLLGPQVGPWSWRLSEGAPDLWSHVLHATSL